MKTIDQQVYESFILTYPVESFEQNPRRFMRLLKRKGIDLTRKQIKKIIEEIK
jgi:hypothetical protein